MPTTMGTDRNLEAYLKRLRDQPERDAQNAARGRAAFLEQAQKIAGGMPVSTGEKERHNRWMHALRSILPIPKKEKTPMFGTLSTIILVITLILGGGGITVAAAQQSLPDEGLYAVKTWSENTRARLTANEQAQLQLALGLAARRGEEIQTMLQAGRVPPAAVQERMQMHYENALRLAFAQPVEQKTQALERIREQLRQQEQQFLDLATTPGAQGEAFLVRTRTMLRERLQLCEDAIQNPAATREQLRNQNKNGGTESPNAPGVGPFKTQPGNPWTTGTPTPLSGYGPGPGPNLTATPAHPGGNNPWVEGTPTPGSGYGPGPGPGDCGDCDGSGGNNPPGGPNNPGNQPNPGGEGGGGGGGGGNGGGGGGGGGGK